MPQLEGDVAPNIIGGGVPDQGLAVPEEAPLEPPEPIPAPPSPTYAVNQATVGPSFIISPPVVAYNRYGYVPGGSSVAKGQAIEAQAIVTPGFNPVYVPIDIEASIPPDTGVTTDTGQPSTFGAQTQTGPPAPPPSPPGATVLSISPINGLDAVNEIFRLGGLADIDPLAIAAVAIHEGAHGGIGDDGTAYGPWQEHLTDGRIPAFVGMPANSRQVQSWAWSPAGFNHAIDGMKAGGASGLARHDAVHAIVYGFEKPANKPKETADSNDTYDGLASYSGDVRALLAPDFVGVGGAVAGTGLPGAPSAPVVQTPQPRPAGVSSAWDDLLGLAETSIPRQHDAVKSLGESLVDVFGG